MTEKEFVGIEQKIQRLSSVFIQMSGVGLVRATEIARRLLFAAKEEREDVAAMILKGIEGGEEDE